MNYQPIIDEIYEELLPSLNEGNVANYIPELANINPLQFGISIYDINGNSYNAGTTDKTFSMQSISKLFTCTMALREVGDEIWGRVGLESSGHAFNSIIQLEQEFGVPRNPFINAGAIVITDILQEVFKNPEMDILEFIEDISLNENIAFNIDMATSEESCGHRNSALSYLMKDLGNLNGDVNSVLKLYYKHCSLAMTCEDLAKSTYYLINKGVGVRGTRILKERNVKRLNSLMMTSGLYNNSGDFAYRVGLPAKSGVGGGIVAVLPGEFTIAVWSPNLNKAGSSMAGIKAMELFTTRTEKSIF